MFFIRLLKKIVRMGIRRNPGTLMLVLNEEGDHVEATDSTGVVLPVYTGEYEKVKRKDEQQ